MSKPKTNSERVAKAAERRQQAGWRRLNLWLPPEAAKQLAKAEQDHGSATAAIVAALGRL